MSERDPELDALWRRHSREDPPAALDDAIRAAAHRAVHAKPTASPRARSPWPAWTTLAAAASIGAIAVGVWQLQPREFDETKVVASDVPGRADARREALAPTAPPPQVALDAAAPRAPSTGRAAPLQQRGESTRDADAVARAAGKPSPFPGASGNVAPSPRDAARATQSAGDRASTENTQPAMAAQAPAASDLKSMPAPPAAAAANGPESASRFAEPAARRADSPAATGAKVTTGAATSRFAEPAAKVAGAQAPADATATASTAATRSAASPAPMRMREDKSAAPRTVADFVEAIRRALADQRDGDARTELVTMRAQYPDADAQLPADLRAWAAGVPRASP
ncbi:MAG TPA: hypothetical protein VGR63_10585 [Casimicrobiaceae bacterium]|nr:hypothetical protein [Casimicrobiaceae bacterium]